MSFLKAVLSFFLSVISLFNIFNGPNEIPRSENNSIKKQNFTYLQYPAEAVKELSEFNLTKAEFTSRADAAISDDVYVQAQGYEDVNGIIISPDFYASVDGYKVPVYATTVFVGETQTGELHSYSEIYVEKDEDFPFSLHLIPNEFIITNAKLLPESLGSELSYTNKTLDTEIQSYGTYTFVFNDDDQEHVFTLFVREKINEEAEIAALKAEYGENNVIVVDGVLEMDYYSVTTSNTVIYLKKGAYVVANHKYDLASDADDPLYNENANSQNAIGLTRFPFLNFYGCQNLKLLGYGVFDMTHLDRRERRGIVFSACKNIEVRGPKIINCPEWSFITYDCENIDIKYTDIFGYRQNSDAYAICNSRNATIDKCFARSGDDLFDVKTLGGSETAISQNIHFTDCIAWAGKARCFGICGEVNKKIDNISFKDCDVLFHDATWDYNRIPTIAIVVEQGGGSISNVTFENINIYKTQTRAIGCLIYSDTVENLTISDVLYKDITYTSPIKDKVASNSQTSNSISIEYNNVVANGSKINNLVTSSYIEYDSYANITVN